MGGNTPTTQRMGVLATPLMRPHLGLPPRFPEPGEWKVEGPCSALLHILRFTRADKIELEFLTRHSTNIYKHVNPHIEALSSHNVPANIKCNCTVVAPGPRVQCIETIRDY